MKKAEVTLVTIVTIIVTLLSSLYIPKETRDDIKQVLEIVIKVDNNSTKESCNER
ncbi:MAG: hypothetical protein U9N33_08115 [Campylobacterota bacterium]|nr:hypothetical protein [Campylobacterota bacterium]